MPCKENVSRNFISVIKFITDKNGYTCNKILLKTFLYNNSTDKIGEKFSKIQQLMAINENLENTSFCK